MENSLAKAKLLDLIVATKNIAASVGPLLISQWDSSSEAYERHQRRMINAETLKTFLNAEANSLSEMRDSLRKRYLDASPEERIRLRQDIEYSERDIQQLKIVTNALDYSSTFVTSSSDKCTDIDQEESPQQRISGHWMDKFNQLSRSKNEEWRQDLLSRALAAEAANPGSVSPRALWLIGTLEEDKFQAFAAILDISSIMGGVCMIPSNNPHCLKILSCDLGIDITIGNLVYQLGDTGLLAEYLASITVEKEQQFKIECGQLVYFLECRNDLHVSGLVPSTIGSCIAVFYERKTNSFGQQLLSDWLASLDNTLYKIVK
jgi:Protein of unknown function (DUF2806)